MWILGEHSLNLHYVLSPRPSGRLMLQQDLKSPDKTFLCSKASPNPPWRVALQSLRRWMLQDFQTACQGNSSQEGFRGKGFCSGKGELVLEELVQLKRSCCLLQSCQGQSCGSLPAAACSARRLHPEQSTRAPRKSSGCCSAATRDA